MLFFNIFYIFRKSTFRNTINILQFINLYKKKKYFSFFFKILYGQVLLKKYFKYIYKYKTILNNKYFFEDEDWFSHNIPIWFWVLNNFKNKINYLEIGCYEGRSLCFISEINKKIKITAVDPFVQYPDNQRTLNSLKFSMKTIYLNFLKNLKIVNKKINFYKKSSKNFFLINKKKFDLIYIDGSHYYLDVLNDLLQSSKIVNLNGVIVLDDFIWRGYKKIEHNPIGGILPFLNKNPNFKVLCITNQIVIKKIF